METKEIIKKVEESEFLDKVYQFAYRRCNTSFEAEDLCSDIILEILTAVHKQQSVENFYAFAWTIARRVYADYCEKQAKKPLNVSIENVQHNLALKENDIDKFVEEIAERAQIKRIFDEISFLSKTYRDVMVMYYVDEYKIKDIAKVLEISETTVKQRLFSARNSIRKEVKNMNDRKLTLKPIQLEFVGTGKVGGNDPRKMAGRLFSQNLIYLCKDKARTAKELSEELCVPMPFIEEELEIQCKGENGHYGTLRKLENGKYITNIILVDYNEYDEANKIYEKYLPKFCERLKIYLKNNEAKILAIPYLSEQRDVKFILWALINRIVGDLIWKINNVINDKYFSDIVPVERDFSCVAMAYDESTNPDWGFYGCDTIDAASVEGYKAVHISNIYGDRIEKHFECGHNISQDAKLLMVLRAVNGLSLDELTENEKEVAAKAIECGYLRKNGNILEPQIIVLNRGEDEQNFNKLSYEANNDMQDIIEKIAEELADFVKTHIQKHLVNEYQLYTTLIASIRFHSQTIEECIKEGLLSEPKKPLGAEGVVMVVEK